MKKILNKRLEMISAFIEDEEMVIDIGCDHGLLGIYLMLNRKNIKVISSDIHEGPLKKAQENLVKYHLEGKIETRLGDGLEVLTSDIETVIISGMGGITITNILNNINDYMYVKKLILSPNNDFSLVRKKIMEHGFMIKKETMVYEKGKYYPVMEFILGDEKINPFFGKMDLKDLIVKKYYTDLYHHNEEILKKKNNIKLQYENELIENNVL